MSGQINHEPAKIIQQLLIDLGEGSAPATSGDQGLWPIYVNALVNEPDDIINVVDQTGTIDGFNQIDHEAEEREGIQIIVRSGPRSRTEGYAKASSIKNTIRTVIDQLVNVDGTQYVVHSIFMSSAITPTGSDTPNSKRKIHSLNYLLMGLRLASDL